MISSIMLALSTSLDSFGIGITYGIKNAKIKILSKCILALMSICFTCASFFIGDFINSIFYLENLTGVISSSIFIFMGILIIIDPIPFDFNHSNGIDVKEAFVLGIALSLDSMFIGISSSIGGLYTFYFPIFVTGFQLIFLSLGSFLGRKIANKFSIPDKTLNFISRWIYRTFWNC